MRSPPVPIPESLPVVEKSLPESPLPPRSRERMQPLSGPESPVEARSPVWLPVMMSRPELTGSVEPESPLPPRSRERMEPLSGPESPVEARVWLPVVMSRGELTGSVER